MKKLLTLVLLISTGIAHASYELMLAVDSTSRVIRRYDPISGASFGSFGQGLLNIPADVVANADGTAWVLEHVSNRYRLKLFNYSTGTLLRTLTEPTQLSFGFATNNSQLALFNQSFLVTEGGALGNNEVVSEFGPAGSFVRAVGPTAPAPVIGAAVSSDGRFLYRSSGNNIDIIGTGSTTPVLGTVTQGSSVRHLAIRGDELFSVNHAGELTSYTISSTGLLALNRRVTITGFLPNTAHGLAIGHDRMIFVGGTDLANANNGRVVRVDARSFDVLGAFSTPGLTSGLRGMDMVVAPEPGTLLALGVGLAALIRRRRKSS